MSLFDTIALVAVVENMKMPSSFLLDRFFPEIVTSDTEFVAIDVFNGKRRMAPFCSPLVEGKVVESLGWSTTEFKPAYLKDKRIFDPKRPVRRAIGERIGGALQPAERAMANLQFEMEDQIGGVNRRLEWMAAQALALGIITVSGEGFETVSVNFGRAAEQTLTLAGADRWGQAGVRPSADVDRWSTQILKSSGLIVTDLVFTPGAWDEYKQDPDVLRILQNTFIPPTLTLDVGPRAAETGGQFMGTIGGYRCWRYFDWYVDEADGEEKPMIADNTVILGCTGMRGARTFGAIMDEEFDYAALPYAPKSWVEKDPAVRMLLMQSSPLVVPTNVNGSMSVVVK